MTRTRTESNEHRARRGRGDGGFTLSELMITLSIFVVVSTMTLTHFSRVLSSTANIDRSTTAATNARLAVADFTRDFRQATTQDSAVKPVVTSTTTTFTFYSPDRLSPMHLRRISYRLLNGNLERAVQTSTAVNRPPWTGLQPWTTTVPAPVWVQVVSNVNMATSQFTYLDAAGAATTTAANVRTVRLKLEIATGLAPTGKTVINTETTIRTYA